MLVSGTFFEDKAVVTPSGWRTEFLTQLGFAIPDDVGQYVDGDQALVPRDRMVSVLDSADVLIWTTESDEEQAALLADPTFAQLKATKTNRNVLHRKGSGRRDRLRLGAVVPGGGRQAAADARPRRSPDKMIR